MLSAGGLDNEKIGGNFAGDGGCLDGGWLYCIDAGWWVEQYIY